MELSGAKKAGNDPARRQAVGKMMNEQNDNTNQTVGPTLALQDLTGFRHQPAYIEQARPNAFQFHQDSEEEEKESHDPQN